MINARLQLGLPVTRGRGVPWSIPGIVGAGEFIVTAPGLNRSRSTVSHGPFYHPQRRSWQAPMELRLFDQRCLDRLPTVRAHPTTEIARSR